MKYKDIIVIVPTLNNDLTIQNVVDDILSFGYKVIVIDDGYTNPVSNFLKQNDNVTIIRHEINQGKGQAILTGAKKVKEFGYDYFVSMDGDGQHLAREVHKLLEARNEDEQLIIGSRNFDIDNIPVKSKIGRAFHNFWIRLNCGYDISDSLTGFRLYPVSILDLGIKTKGFSFEIEVLVKHYWKNEKIKDIVIECYYPSPEERVSHFNNYKDTIRFIIMHFKLFFLKCKNYLLSSKNN